MNQFAKAETERDRLVQALRQWRIKIQAWMDDDGAGYHEVLALIGELRDSIEVVLQASGTPSEAK